MSWIYITCADNTIAQSLSAIDFHFPVFIRSHLRRLSVAKCFSLIDGCSGCIHIGDDFGPFLENADIDWLQRYHPDVARLDSQLFGSVRLNKVEQLVAWKLNKLQLFIKNVGKTTNETSLSQLVALVKYFNAMLNRARTPNDRPSDISGYPGISGFEGHFQVLNPHRTASDWKENVYLSTDCLIDSNDIYIQCKGLNGESLNILGNQLYGAAWEQLLPGKREVDKAVLVCPPGTVIDLGNSNSSVVFGAEQNTPWTSTEKERDSPLFANVFLSVYSEVKIRPNQTSLVQVFIHEANRSVQVSAQAKSSDPQSESRGSQPLATSLPRDAELCVHLSAQNIEIDPPFEKVNWNGGYIVASFAITVPHDYQPDRILFKATIINDGVPVGHLRFMVLVTRDEPRDAAYKPVAHEVKRYRKAFVSYSSNDRVEVLKRLQMLRLQSIEFFQDLFDLKPGELWENSLYKRIEDSDLFLLFWSKSAKESEWVEKEWRYALECKGGEEQQPPEIVPVILEPPPPTAPPEELKQLHFRDYLMYLAKAEEAVKKSADV